MYCAPLEIIMPPKPTKSFRISQEIIDALAACATRMDRSEGWVVERALTEYLKARRMLPSDDQPTS
jgi:predicted transcriptional regulator